MVGSLLSSADAAIANGELPGNSNDQFLTARAAGVLERVFGWGHDDIFGAQALTAPRTAAALARFKMPKRRLEVPAEIYATYANHLAVVSIQGMAGCSIKPVPTDPGEMRKRILARGEGKDDLRAVLNTVWDLGVVVLPLRGKGTFHGACWRYEGRNAIVLKQTSKHETRWTFDLLHELYHAAQRPEEMAFDLVEAETMSRARQESDQEIAASKFAGDVMLDGRADDLVQDCVVQADNVVSRLKGVVRRVARTQGVNVGALANYLAFHLSVQGLNWWGTAANLQPREGDPWKIARDAFAQRHPYRILNEIDRSLLDRALN